MGGYRRQPRTVRFSSDAICSMLAFAFGQFGVGGEKCVAHGVRALPREFEIHFARKKPSGICSNMPAPSPVFGVRPNRAAMIQVAQRLQTLGDDVAAGMPVRVATKRRRTNHVRTPDRKGPPPCGPSKGHEQLP